MSHVALTFTWQVFLYATKQMEGNTSTGCVLLAEWSRLVLKIDKLEEASRDPHLKRMLTVTRIKLEGYQAEAVASYVVVLSTIHNPRFRIRFFDLKYPEEACWAEHLFTRAFEEALEGWPQDPITLNSDNSNEIEPQPSAISSILNFSEFDVFTTQVVSQPPAYKCRDKRVNYIEGGHLLLAGQNELDWWKVSFICSLRIVIFIWHFCLLHTGAWEGLPGPCFTGFWLCRIIRHIGPLQEDFFICSRHCSPW